MKIISLLNNPIKTKDIDKMFELDIADDEHFLYSMVDELKKTPSNSLVIWGTYANALKCSNYIKRKYNIDVDACVVNEEYLKIPINNVNEKGLKITSIERWFKEQDKTDIIIDFSFFKEELLAGYIEKINRVFIGDIMGTFVFDYPYIITEKNLIINKEKICSTYNLFEDEESREEYREFIYQKVYGFYNKKHHQNQYFDRDVIELNTNEVFVDCGAYDGDTIRDFLKHVASYRKIYALEMDNDNYHMIEKNVRNLDNCVCINKGVGKKKTREYAVICEKTSSHLSLEGDTVVEIDSLDNLIHEEVTFIKMDIEGAELDALKGAEKLIKKYRPKLAICMYHKFEDLWEIPEIINSYSKDYRLYFRNYHNSGSEAILYAL